MVRPVRVLLFATAREAAGSGSIARRIPPGGVPIRELVESLCEEFPRLRSVVRVSRLVKNGEYVRGDGETIRPGDELAIHPPYSGG